jgi:biopolymer transport protein TolR
MAAGPGESEGGTISGINVTPLVDVMLVLLVIFMVTTPMIQQGVTVDLPNASAGALPKDETPLLVSVTADGSVYLNETKLDVTTLTTKLLAILKESPSKVVYMRADQDARYGAVVAVMAALENAGINQLGMVTEPGEG